jgi:Mitochondrial carrier protein
MLLGLQTQSNSNPTYRGPLDAVKKIYCSYGIKGIYKGQSVTLLREASGYGVYFWTYEKLVQREMTKKGVRRDEISPANAVLYGAAAGYVVSIAKITPYSCTEAHINPALVVGPHIPDRHDQISDADRWFRSR